MNKLTYEKTASKGYRAKPDCAKIMSLRRKFWALLSASRCTVFSAGKTLIKEC